MTTYRPDFVRQWGDTTTTLDWFNCNMASGAMALDFDTLGSVKLTGGQLRAYSGDTTGGTNLAGVAKAWAYYGQTLDIRTGLYWTNALDALKQYRAVILNGMYGELPARYQSPLNSLSFAGAHGIVLLPEFNGNGDILMGDPLNDKFIFVPQSYLKAFATALGRRDLGGSTPQRIFFAVSDAHVPVASDPVPYAHTVQVTANPFVNIREAATAGSADVGNLAYGAKIRTTHLRRKGGRYTVNGVIRTDWLGFSHNGETDWIARAYTKVVS